MDHTYSFYEVEYKPPVAWVYLNRPAKKNAMNAPAWTEPVDLFDQLDQDPEIRVIVISGRGSCFSAGIDMLAMLPELPELLNQNQLGEVKWDFLPRLRRLQEGITAVERCRKPVIGAIHGHCVGAGLDLATACDIRLCSTDAIFSLKESALGFVADVGVLQRIPLIIGQGLARELAFTAEDFSSERAREMLLVNRVYEDHDALIKGTAELAERIAANPPVAVQASKDVLNFCVGKSIDDGLRYVAAVSSAIIPSQALLDSMKMFSKKQPK